MKPIFKKTSTGKIQKWSMEVEGSKFRTSEGIVGGKITTTKWTQCHEKNVGKKNYISAEDQAIKEVEAKYKLKLKKGYYKTIKEAEGHSRFEPMLAHKYQDYSEKVVFPTLHDNKLDGMRCYVTKNGLFSREHNPIYGVPHIWDSIKKIYDTCDSEIIFDGELYNHDLKDDFNKIISCVKKSTDLTPEVLAESEKYIQFHCYDMFNPNDSDLTCTQRRSWLKLNLEKFDYIKIPTLTLCSNQAQLDEEFKKAKELGYEGQMIRENTHYTQGRCFALLKRKDFIDEEFEITGYEEGKGNRQGGIGKLIMKTKDNKSFEADFTGMGGLKAYEEMWKVRDTLIGKMATVVYQKLTPRGVPKFGKIKAIRDYE